MQFALIIAPNDTRELAHAAVNHYFDRMASDNLPQGETTVSTLTIPGLTNPTAPQTAAANFAASNPDSAAAAWLAKQARLVAGERIELTEGERAYCVANGIPTNDAPTIAGERDVQGMPWDARIHASTKTKTDKGVWTKRRNVSEIDFNRISAEVRATVGAPAPASNLAPVTQTPAGNPAPFSHFTTGTTAPAGNADGFAAIAQMQADTDAQAKATPPGLPGLSTPPGLPGLPTLPAAKTPYQEFIDFVTANMHDAEHNPTGKLTDDFVLQVVAHFGAKGADGRGSLEALQHRPDITKAAHDYLVSQLG